MADCAARAPAPAASKVPAHIAHPPHTAKPTHGDIVGHVQVRPAILGIIAMPVLDLGVSIDRSIMPLLLSRLSACQVRSESATLNERTLECASDGDACDLLSTALSSRLPKLCFCHGLLVGL